MTPDETRKLTDDLNAWANKTMAQFVMSFGHLDEASFAARLEQFIAITEARSRERIIAAGRTWDPLDDLLYEACRRAAWRIYEGMRTSGTSGGSA